MLETITSIQTDYKHKIIVLEYNDGQIVKVDFKPIIEKGGVMSILHDSDVFKKVSIGPNGRYLQWPDDIEFCADALRQKYLK
ncbi:MAG: DUF2442 domain-containing protein [Proteobacteria bacterium]|nr:DUF2442 domain-containing protein [Pseudomonadota bacterium]